MAHDTWIGIDFDGTLAEDGHHDGPEDTGPPIEPMVRQVRRWLREGYDVRLFTARKPHPALRRWMQEHLGTVLKITNVKEPGMICFYDDRAVGVKRNEGVVFSKDNETEAWKE